MVFLCLFVFLRLVGDLSAASRGTAVMILGDSPYLAAAGGGMGASGNLLTAFIWLSGLRDLSTAIFFFLFCLDEKGFQDPISIARPLRTPR